MSPIEHSAVTDRPGQPEHGSGTGPALRSMADPSIIGRWTGTAGIVIDKQPTADQGSEMDAWSAAWKNPTITSFVGQFPESYDGPILEFWQSQMADMPEHVVDLACGNGALTWIANDILNCEGPRARITGFDFANIDPFKALKRNPRDYPQVRFVGNTPIENLPLESASVDLAISQYGFEYSNLEDSVPEVARILKPGGRLSLIMHDQDSVIVRQAVDLLGDSRDMLDFIKLHDLALEKIDLQAKFAGQEAMEKSPAFHDLQSRIRRALDELTPRVGRHPRGSMLHNYFSTIHRAVNDPGIGSRDRRTKMVKSARDGLTRGVRRISALAEAALSEEGLDELCRLLEAQQRFVVRECRKLRYKGGEPFGTILVAETAAAGAPKEN